VRALQVREFIDLHRQSGEHESERAPRVAAARSEEKIEEARTLYYMVNFIIGQGARRPLQQQQQQQQQ